MGKGHLRWLIAGATIGALAACKREGGQTTAGLATAATGGVAVSAALSAGAAPPASSAAAAPEAEGGPPVGGVGSFTQVDEVKACQLKSRDLEPNLAFGGLGMAARGKDLGVAWHYRSKVKTEGLLAFGGYDSTGRTLAAGHGLGKGSLFAPRVFPHGNDWVVSWFDAQGLVFTRASWSPAPGGLGRLAAVTAAQAEHTAIAPTTEGPLLATAPLAGSSSAQLGLFLFAPSGDADSVKAIGATHHASRPQHPAVSELGDGYVVAWEDEPEAGKARQLVVTRFDVGGKELGSQLSISTPGRPASRPALVSSPQGATIAWVEQEGEASVVVVRAIDKAGMPLGPSYRVDAGSAPVLVAVKGGSVLAFLRKAAGAPAQIAAVHVGLDGKPSASGLLVSEPGKGKGQVVEAPAAAVSEDGRLALAFTYAEGMKAALRTIVLEGCLSLLWPRALGASVTPCSRRC